jgi:hypothetical protein
VQTLPLSLKTQSRNGTFQERTVAGIRRCNSESKGTDGTDISSATDGSGTAFWDGLTGSAASIGDAALVTGCAILPKSAICVRQVSGDLGYSVSAFALREIWLAGVMASLRIYVYR